MHLEVRAEDGQVGVALNGMPLALGRAGMCLLGVWEATAAVDLACPSLSAFVLSVYSFLYPVVIVSSVCVVLVQPSL